MVCICRFFFSSRKLIHLQYKGFFGIEEEDERFDNEGVEDTPEMATKEATARFYFALLYKLTGNDITKFEEVEQQPLYLCLNVLSLEKDRNEKEKEEYEKIKKQMKM